LFEQVFRDEVEISVFGGLYFVIDDVSVRRVDSYISFGTVRFDFDFPGEEVAYFVGFEGHVLWFRI